VAATYSWLGSCATCNHPSCPFQSWVHANIKSFRASCTHVFVPPHLHSFMHQFICPSLARRPYTHQLRHNLLAIHIGELSLNHSNLVRDGLAALCSLLCAASHVAVVPWSMYCRALQGLAGNIIHVASVTRIMYCRAWRETSSM